MIQKETEDFDHSPWGDTDEEYAPEDDPIDGQTDGDATDVDGDVPLKVAKRRRTVSGSGFQNTGKGAMHRDVVDLASASEISRGDSVSPTEWAYKQLKETYKRVGQEFLFVMQVLTRHRPAIGIGLRLQLMTALCK